MRDACLWGTGTNSQNSFINMFRERSLHSFDITSLGFHYYHFALNKPTEPIFLKNNFFPLKCIHNIPELINRQGTAVI